MLNSLLVGGGANFAQGSGRHDIASKYDDRVTTALVGSDCKRLEFYSRRQFNLDIVRRHVLMDGWCTRIVESIALSCDTGSSDR